MAPVSDPETVPSIADGRSKRSGLLRVATAALIVVTVLLATVTVRVGWVVTGNGPDAADAVRDELAFQRSALEGGSAEAAQEQFPEGYFFSYVLYGLSWTDLAEAGDAEIVEARAEAGWARERIDSPEGRRVFEPSLEPSHGIFYAGWALLLRAQIAALPTAIPAPDDPGPPPVDPVPGPVGPDLELDGDSDRPRDDERRRLARDADAIAAAFEANLDAGRSPFLMAYPGRSWPVDSVVAMAALRRADQVTGDDHGPLIDRWLRRADDLVDPRTGLLPHETDPVTGELIDGSRGTSQSLIQRMWPTVDPTTAAAAYRRFRTHFVTRRAGFVGVREYPAGVDGTGDVDSGPLVLGFSASATTVGAGAARANGDHDLADSLFHEADVFGLPLTISGARRYAFGLLPIGDAFVTWARAAPAAPARTFPGTAARWPLFLLVPWAVVAAAWWFVRARSTRPGPSGEPSDETFGTLAGGQSSTGPPPAGQPASHPATTTVVRRASAKPIEGSEHP